MPVDVYMILAVWAIALALDPDGARRAWASLRRR